MVSGRINRDLHATTAVQLLCTVKEIFPGILVGENQGTCVLAVRSLKSSNTYSLDAKAPT